MGSDSCTGVRRAKGYSTDGQMVVPGYPLLPRYRVVLRRTSNETGRLYARPLTEHTLHLKTETRQQSDHRPVGLQPGDSATAQSLVPSGPPRLPVRKGTDSGESRSSETMR